MSELVDGYKDGWTADTNKKQNGFFIVLQSFDSK
jgi:hypothetical protein